MPRMTKDQIVTAVYRLIADAEGYDTDALNGMRQKALDYYYNRPGIAPTIDGRSTLQSSDVADMVEAVTAQMMPAFEGENIVEFEPTGEEDVDQARAESNACNWVLMHQNMGHVVLEEAVRDALLLRNGVVKVYLDERIDTESFEQGPLTEMEYGQVMMGASQDLTDVDNGYTVELLEEDRGFYQVRIVEKTTERKVCVESIDPANFSWERDYNSIFLQDARFCAERTTPTRSDLIRMGYKKSIVNKLNYGGNETSVDALARNQHGQTREWQGVTPADDRIEVHECYVRLDADGDGLSELLKIVVADKQILEMTDMEYIPFASGTPYLQPHRFNGLGLYDKLHNVQDAKTFTLRQGMDNLNHANNSRVIAVDGAVNIDDVVQSRPGGVVRSRAPGSVEPFPFNDVGPSVQSWLDYMDKVRSERGGASLDMQSAEMQIAGDTAHGVERQMSAKEQQAAKMTRTMAETLLRSTFLLIHKALRLYVPDELQFRVSDKFVRVNPAEWPERKAVCVKAGLSMAERMKKKAALETVVMRQDAMTQAGQFVSPEDRYNAHLDWCRVQGLDDPERYFTDPQSQEAQQAAQQQAQQAAQQQQFQEQLLQMQLMVEQRKADNEDAKVMEDQRQHDGDLRFKYWEATQKFAHEEAAKATDVALGIVNGERNNQAGSGEPAGQSGADDAA